MRLIPDLTPWRPPAPASAKCYDGAGGQWQRTQQGGGYDIVTGLARNHSGDGYSLFSGFVALGSSYPTIGSSGHEIVDWFADHGVRARAYAWTAAFVSLGLAIFGGQVAALLPTPHRYIFFAGVLGFAITAQVQAWVWAGLASHPQGLDEAAARTIFDIASYWGPLVNGSTTAMAAAVAALGFGASPIIPRWLAWLSVVFFLEQAVETITVFGQAGFIAPGGAMNVYLGGALGFLWVAGVVHWALQRMDPAP